MATLKLLEEARSAGLKLRTEGDQLVIRGPKSAKRIAQALLDRKAEILPFLREQPAAPQPFFHDAREHGPDASSWLCPHCGHPATIDDMFPSLDGERVLTMWSCEPCQVVAVTPNAIKEPPTGWVPKTRQ
jgi:hypothetical protein